MQKANFMINLVFVASILFFQVGGVRAAPALQNSPPVTGMVESIVLETDSTTGVTIVIVDLLDGNDLLQRVRVSQETAIALGIVVINGDGKPGINNLALGRAIEIHPDDVIPTQEENQHPVGSALATFFSDITGLDYESIMTAHKQGMGFGTIAQTLWLTKKLEGTAEVFKALIEAKLTGDFSEFILEDGSTPKNWGQLKKSILDADKNGSGSVAISDITTNITDNQNENETKKDNEKNKEKDSNGNNNRNDKDKEKEKNK